MLQEPSNDRTLWPRPHYTHRKAPETVHGVQSPLHLLCFHLAVERERWSCWFKSGLQLATNTRERGRRSVLLPPLSSLPFKRSDSHETPQPPQRPWAPVLVPALTNAALPTNTTSLLDSHTPKHLIHATVCSVPSERSQLPLHLRARKWKTCVRERKKEVAKFTVQTTSSVFRNYWKTAGPECQQPNYWIYCGSMRITTGEITQIQYKRPKIDF